jgi:hypothetical protein
MAEPNVTHSSTKFLSFFSCFDFQHLQHLRQDNFTAKMLSGDITSVVVMASMWKLSMTFITTLKMVFVMQLL